MTRKASPWDKRTWLCESPIREGKQSRNSGFSTSPPAQSAGTLWLLSVNDLKSPIVQQKYPKLWMVAKSCTKRMRETLPWDKPHINWWFHTSYPTVKEQQQYDPRVVPGGLQPPILLGYTIGGSIWYCQFLSRHPAAHWASLEVKRSGSRTSFPDPEKPSTGSQNGENQMIIRYIAPGDCTNYPRAISPNCWPNRFHATFLWAHMSTHNITNAQMDVHINFTLQISWSSSTFFFKTRKLITRISPGFF